MNWPTLQADQLANTRDALHSYAQVLGDWLKATRPRRKHWWHASLRPSLRGLTTGVIAGPVPFELELNLADSLLEARTDGGASVREPLAGQAPRDLAVTINLFLTDAGLDTRDAPAISSAQTFEYAPEQANAMGAAFSAVAAALADFRADIPEETSPIQLWPHHFDLAMLWLPGEKISGQDPADEEYSDKQMNFGFVLGDETIAEPYFYVTAYPTPEGMAEVSLPAGAQWRSEGFTGAVLPYAGLLRHGDPQAELLKLWRTLLDAGRERMLSAALAPPP
jgi:hypothetical protein